MDLKNVVRLLGSVKGLFEVCGDDFKMRLVSMICVFFQLCLFFLVYSISRKVSLIKFSVVIWVRCSKIGEDKGVEGKYKG